jgi:hypothetical protein
MNLIRLAAMEEFNCLDTETRLVKFKQQVEVAARKNSDNQWVYVTHTRRSKRRLDGTVTTKVEPIRYSLGMYSELTVQDTAEPCEEKIWDKEDENQETESKKSRIEGKSKKKGKSDSKRKGDSSAATNARKRKNDGVVDGSQELASAGKYSRVDSQNSSMTAGTPNRRMILKSRTPKVKSFTPSVLKIFQIRCKLCGEVEDKDHLKTQCSAIPGTPMPKRSRSKLKLVKRLYAVGATVEPGGCNSL